MIVLGAVKGETLKKEIQAGTFCLRRQPRSNLEGSNFNEIMNKAPSFPPGNRASFLSLKSSRLRIRSGVEVWSKFNW